MIIIKFDINIKTKVVEHCICNMPIYKAPGNDEIRVFGLKILPETYDGIEKALNNCVTNGYVLELLVEVRKTSS